MINSYESQDRNLFNKQYYQDITHRTDVQSMLRKLKEQQEEQTNVNDAKAAISGASNATRLAAQNNTNKAYSDAVADIASDASRLKDQYLENWRNRQRDYMMSRLSLDNPETAILQNRSNQLSAASAGAFQAGAGLLANGLGGLNGIGSAGKPVVKPTNIPTSDQIAQTIKPAGIASGVTVPTQWHLDALPK